MFGVFLSILLVGVASAATNTCDSSSDTVLSLFDNVNAHGEKGDEGNY